MFQFHTGSIKSARGCVPAVSGGQRFNSTLVRLKESYAPMQGLADWLRFNSTLVRLKVLGFEGGGFAFVKFQFHTGSIKRVSRLRLQ